MRASRTVGHCSLKLNKTVSKAIRQHLTSQDEILTPILSERAIRIPWGAVSIARTKRLEHIFAGTGDRYAEKRSEDLHRSNVRLVDDGEHVMLYLDADPCQHLSGGRETFRVNIEVEDDALTMRTT